MFREPPHLPLCSCSVGLLIHSGCTGPIYPYKLKRSFFHSTVDCTSFAWLKAFLKNWVWLSNATYVIISEYRLCPYFMGNTFFTNGKHFRIFCLLSYTYFTSWGSEPAGIHEDLQWCEDILYCNLCSAGKCSRWLQLPTCCCFQDFCKEWKGLWTSYTSALASR